MKKGGAPIGNQNARKKTTDNENKNNQKQPETTVGQPETTKKQGNDNVNDNVNDNDNVNVNVNDNVKEKDPPKSPLGETTYWDDGMPKVYDEDGRLLPKGVARLPDGGYDYGNVERVWDDG